MPNPRPPAAWLAVSCWCAVAGWIAFVDGARVPLLSLVDFGFHELGHLAMYVLPINQILTAAMGSIMQCAVPAGLALYFFLRRRDGVAACACAAWAATNFQDASVYIADAPYQRLELIGGEHDWAYVFGPDGLNRMHDAHIVAAIVHDAGLIALLAATVCALYGLYRGVSDSGSATPAPGVATASRSDDLFPSR